MQLADWEREILPRLSSLLFSWNRKSLWRRKLIFKSCILLVRHPCHPVEQLLALKNRESPLEMPLDEESSLQMCCLLRHIKSAVNKGHDGQAWVSMRPYLAACHTTQFNGTGKQHSHLHQLLLPPLTTYWLGYTQVQFIWIEKPPLHWMTKWKDSLNRPRWRRGCDACAGSPIQLSGLAELGDIPPPTTLLELTCPRLKLCQWKQVQRRQQFLLLPPSRNGRQRQIN